MSIERVEGQSHVTVSVLSASSLALAVGGQSLIDTSPVYGGSAISTTVAGQSQIDLEDV
jgi:hypothetical protein